MTWRRQTHVARQIVQALGSIPSVVILSQVGITSVQIWKKVMTDVQDSFYRRHTPEQVLLAHANRIDFDHPDAIDMPLFAAVRQLIPFNLRVVHMSSYVFV